MELRVLGAHNLESKETRLASYLIDGVLALDAGSLSRALSFDEQSRIRAIALSHRHYDHVRDLPPFGLAIRDTGVTVDIFAIKDTADAVSSKLLDGTLFPDLINSPSPENPTFRLNVVGFGREFNAMDYTLMAVPMDHAVPAAGFLVTSGDVSLFYTGDVGPDLAKAWEHVSPDVLLTEVTFGDENQVKAVEVGHLTATLLGEALQDFQQQRGFLPRVIVSHVNPPWEKSVREELKALSDRLGIEILVAHADMEVSL